ncbi:MAG: AMP-dependent synthetase [Firmicutes bacterium ML8_F2]|nr:MAG: AMP-dependent synthetase [Firmicutes bacterium ML8_F2]
MKRTDLYETRPINNLKELLKGSAEIYGDKAAFLAKSRGGGEYKPISYRQYAQDVDAFGTALMNLGLADKNIALISENRYGWSVTYLTTLNGVGTIVPLDKELPEQEVENLLKRSGAKAVVYGFNNAKQIASIAKRLDFVDFYINMDLDEDSGQELSFDQLLAKGHRLLESGDDSYITREIDNEAINILLFTSGTTDISKGVMLSHKNLCTNLVAMSSMLYIGEQDIFLSVLPIHHTYECTCGFLCPIYRGATVAYCEGLRYIPKNLAESKATILLGVPLIYESIYRIIWKQAAKDPGTLKKLKTGLKISNFLKMLGIDISKKLFKPVHEKFGGNIRLFISGAAALDPEISLGIQDLGIPVVQGYGLTECSPIVALNRDIWFKNDAAGLPLPNLEVKIDSPNEDGIGEIIVRGPSVMHGYYENPEATAEALKDGWFYTGDLGKMDSDGFIYITGRKKNVIITKNGKNIYPEEIETLLNRSSYIMESMVYAGENSVGDDLTVAAQIVPDHETIAEEFPNQDMDKEQLYELIQQEVKKVNGQLVSYKGIRKIIIREEEFEKTTTRKIKRYVEEAKS